MNAIVAAKPAAAGTAGALIAGAYAQLQAIARRELGRRAHDSLDASALVHELYLKLGARADLEFAGARQFFAYALRAMRHILLDRAYQRARLKAGGEATHVELSDPGIDRAAVDSQLALHLDGALTALEATDARAARVVELHYFAGLGLDDVAAIVGVSRRTVDRDWRFARAFLMAQVG